ncbi:MAG: hypothetical protein IPH43_10120 [Xanthomonadales bacterium]|nr:hypothetical protein [Xanthomonadales bacterium]
MRAHDDERALVQGDRLVVMAQVRLGVGVVVEHMRQLERVRTVAAFEYRFGLPVQRKCFFGVFQRTLQVGHAMQDRRARALLRIGIQAIGGKRLRVAERGLLVVAGKFLGLAEREQGGGNFALVGSGLAAQDRQ